MNDSTSILRPEQLITVRIPAVLGLAPVQPPVSLAALVQGRGRYTHRRFWRSVLLEALEGDDVSRSIEPVTTRAQARAGFADLYGGRDGDGTAAEATRP
ncbi:MAG: hypothetical protein JW839_01085 [Candidatus Lokiarchaeota archaeon]|nr:hypothetical protein [Candidatus Lokiarchaeota archaeon]